MSSGRGGLVVLREATLFECHLALLQGVVVDDIVVVVDARVRALALATRSSTKSIELRGQLRLRLDERSTVVTHRLVARVGVLGEQSESRRNEDHEQQNKSERSVEDEEDDTHGSGHDALITLARVRGEECW